MNSSMMLITLGTALVDVGIIILTIAAVAYVACDVFDWIGK